MLTSIYHVYLQGSRFMEGDRSSTVTRGVSQYIWNEVWRQVGHQIADYCSTSEWWKASGSSLEMTKVIIIVFHSSFMNCRACLRNGPECLNIQLVLFFSRHAYFSEHYCFSQAPLSSSCTRTHDSTDSCPCLPRLLKHFCCLPLYRCNPAWFACAPPALKLCNGC